MLERILTVSRLESGQLKPHFEPLSLNDLVDDVLHDARFEAAATNATITCMALERTFRSPRPKPVAQRHRKRGAQCHFLLGRGRQDRGEVETIGDEAVCRSDNGPGVPPDKMKLIFEPFYRVDDSRGTTTGGMGLGLAIANNAIVAHGGGVIAAQTSSRTALRSS